jgi:hypothetical protein
MTTKIFTTSIARLIGRGAARVRTFFEAVAESRKQRALIETQLYRGRYKHWSKNDDDLRMVP